VLYSSSLGMPYSSKDESGNDPKGACFISS
jgi:hypothetical protein